MDADVWVGLVRLARRVLLVMVLRGWRRGLCLEGY